MSPFFLRITVKFLKILIIILLFHIALLLILMHFRTPDKQEDASVPAEKSGPILVPEDDDSAPGEAGKKDLSASVRNGNKKSAVKIRRKKLDYSKAVSGKIKGLRELDAVKAGILVDASSGKVLWEKNSKKIIRIASMTKMMTIYLIYEALSSGKLSLNESVKVTKEATKVKGGGIWLDVRESFKLSDLMKAAFIKSANDAAFLLAQTAGDGSVEKFIDMMNKKARQFGLEHTEYFNPHGLPDKKHGKDNVSTCEELVYIAEELIGRYPQVLKLSSTKIAYIPRKVGKVKKTMLTNTNKLVRIGFKGVDGLKTGYTKKAGFCITLTCMRDGRRLIAVLTGCPSSKSRDAAGKKLLDWGFKH